MSPGLRIKENKEVYEGEVTELTPEYTEAAAAGQVGAERGMRGGDNADGIAKREFVGGSV